MATIIIVDDHPVVRMAVRILLESQGHTIIAEADSGVDALALCRKLSPDLVILDIDLPQLDGLEVMRRLTQLQPVKVLVFSTMAADRFASRCMEAGAVGFITKGADLDGLSHAVKAVLSGYLFYPFQEHQPPSQSGRTIISIDELSSREVLVLRYLANGLRNKDIAEQLMLSEKTISTYKMRLIKKLGLSHLVDLIEFAKQNQLI
ncbi:response regulator transcription factor [Aeromonas sobria]|nr:response regulator transcription factor [Aeromonas sobria]